MSISIQQGPPGKSPSEEAIDLPDEAGPGPADDFTVDWYLPKVWCHHPDRGTGGIERSTDQANSRFAFAME
jgi:hypothetical protein